MLGDLGYNLIIAAVYHLGLYLARGRQSKTTDHHGTSSLSYRCSPSDGYTLLSTHSVTSGFSYSSLWSFLPLLGSFSLINPPHPIPTCISILLHASM